MKFFIYILLISSLAFSSEASKNKLIIDADKFEAYDNKGLSVFTGNVKMTRINDKLNADKIEVYMTPKKEGVQNQKREAIKYIATGKANFSVYTLDKHYIGKGDKIIYNPKKLHYEIIGSGFLKEIKENKTLFGEKIYLNQTTGEAKVEGTKNQPVRFIMEIEGDNK